MIDPQFLRGGFGWGPKCLVTGGTGLIGREVCRLLADAGANVYDVSLDDLILPYSQHLKGDLRDFNFCQEILEGVDFLYHVAGIKGNVEVTKSKPASFFVPLLQMNTNLLEAAYRNKNIQSIVYTSSIGAYGNANQEEFVEGEHDDLDPMDFFPGWAKRMGEKQIEAYKIQDHDVRFNVVRPGNIYGPGDNFDPNNAMVIPSLIAKAVQFQEDHKPLILWGDGSSVRDFLYATDCAEGIILCTKSMANLYTPYVNLGSGTGVTIKELVETLQTILPFDYQFDFIKAHNGFPKRVMNIDKAKQYINFSPTTSLKEGLKQTVEWYQLNMLEHEKKQNYFA